MKKITYILFFVSCFILAPPDIQKEKIVKKVRFDVDTIRKDERETTMATSLDALGFSNSRSKKKKKNKHRK